MSSKYDKGNELYKAGVTVEYLQITRNRSSLRNILLLVLCVGLSLCIVILLERNACGHRPGPWSEPPYPPDIFPLGAIVTGAALVIHIMTARIISATTIRELWQNKQGLLLISPGGYTLETHTTRGRGAGPGILPLLGWRIGYPGF